MFSFLRAPRRVIVRTSVLAAAAALLFSASLAGVASADDAAAGPGRTPPPSTPGCSATYSVAWVTADTFHAAVQVTAGSSAISGWKVAMTYPAGAQLKVRTTAFNQNVFITTDGSTVTARNLYPGGLAAGASTSFNFVGTSSSLSTAEMTSPISACAAS